MAQVANSRPEDVEVLLLRSAPFESGKARGGEDGDEDDARERAQTRTFWVTGEKGLTEAEAARKIVAEAREIITKELGLPEGGCILSLPPLLGTIGREIDGP